MMHHRARYTVIGAGNGGKSMAAHLALLGCHVTLYNRTAETIALIRQRGAIELEGVGCPEGTARLANVTSDMGQAVDEATIIHVVVPSTGHADVAKAMAPHLSDGQIVVLHPGRTGGALEFDRVLRMEGCRAKVILAEAETLLYACRSDGPAQARIFRIKEAVPLAALPAVQTRTVLEALGPFMPQYIDGNTVLHTSLNNMGAIFHPALALLNAGRIESTRGEFQFYIDGVTPSVARVLEALDRERMTVAASLGVRARSAREWLRMAYNAEGDSLFEAIQNQPGYRGIKAPATLNHRYIREDVPMSLVPMAELGEAYGVSVHQIRSMIELACTMHQTDYRRRGRTLDRLGIDGMSVPELHRFVREGLDETP
jgi:opine dehydrogenase